MSEQLNSPTPNALTQKDFDQLHEQALKQWKKDVEQSGLSESLFIALNREAVISLFWYKQAQDLAKSKKLHLPNLVEGLTITEWEN